MKLWEIWISGGEYLKCLSYTGQDTLRYKVSAT